MVLGVSLKKVWMLMNTLQILTNVPLLAIALPSNVLFTLQSLADLAKFNIIPKAQIKKYLRELNLSSTSGEESNENKQKGNFKTMGFENSNIFENLGLLFFVLVGFVAIGIIVFALRVIVKKFKWQDHSKQLALGHKSSIMRQIGRYSSTHSFDLSRKAIQISVLQHFWHYKICPLTPNSKRFQQFSSQFSFQCPFLQPYFSTGTSVALKKRNSSKDLAHSTQT
ncbi:hypothetical protein FGO68_gene3259 [Halteria grandinella]|uniref:Uncharacterized protein n=1 Tax=Halteria grandinella TaxID=5974 RepID=A0A8J8SXU6_HALGN|nr:hypothetical protein FGO68_gene3259 [Halteria grandinella]